MLYKSIFSMFFPVQASPWPNSCLELFFYKIKDPFIQRIPVFFRDKKTPAAGMGADAA